MLLTQTASRKSPILSDRPIVRAGPGAGGDPVFRDVGHRSPPEGNWRRCRHQCASFKSASAHTIGRSVPPTQSVSWGALPPGLPRFLGNPDCPFAHVPATPAGLLAPDRFTVQQRGPRYMNSEGSHERSFDAQWHGFRTRCVRFAVRVTHAPRNTRFRPLVRRYRTGFPPAGFR